MQQYGNTAAERFDRRNAVALHRRHQEKMRRIVELPELAIAQITVEVNTFGEAEIRRQTLHRLQRRTLAHNVEVPIHPRREDRRLMFELFKPTENPVDPF